MSAMKDLLEDILYDMLILLHEGYSREDSAQAVALDRNLDVDNIIELWDLYGEEEVAV